MLYFTLISVATMLLIGLWFVYRRNVELMVCCLVVLNFECFYVLPEIGEAETYRLLILPISAIFILGLSLKHGIRLGRYGSVMISFLVLSGIALIVATLSGQEMVLGLKAVKLRTFVLGYFLVVALEINDVKFARYYVILGLIVAGLVCIQYGLYGHINLFKYAPDKFIHERIGLRISIGAPLIATATCISFARFVRTSSIFFLAAAIFLFAVLAVIEQIRIYIAGAFLCMLILYGLARNFSAARLFSYILIALLLASSWQLAVKPLLSNVGLVKLTQSEIQHKGGSAGARIESFTYYLKEIGGSVVFGRGVLNLEWKNNPTLRLQSQGIHLSDIGIVHLFVESGLLGLIWLVYAFSRFWPDILRFRDSLHVSSYIILGTIIIPLIDLFVFDYMLFIFATFLGLLSKSIERQTCARA